MCPSLVEDLKARYLAEPDTKMLGLALASGDLTAPARHALSEALAIRGLAPGLQKVLDMDVETLPCRQFDEYVTLVQNAACPVCSSQSSPLNGVTIKNPALMMVVSGLVAMAAPGKLKIGCQSCLSKAGFWTLRKLKPGQKWKPERPLIDFVRTFAGILAVYGNQTSILSPLLKQDFAGVVTRIAEFESPPS